MTDNTTDRYGIVGFNVPIDTLSIILETILWVAWPNQQCHSTEGKWLVNQVKGQPSQGSTKSRVNQVKGRSHHAKLTES